MVDSTWKQTANWNGHAHPFFESFMELWSFMDHIWAHLDQIWRKTELLQVFKYLRYQPDIWWDDVQYQAGKLKTFGTRPNWVVSYIAYTKFHSPRPVFHLPSQIFTRIGEWASANFPAWVPSRKLLFKMAMLSYFLRVHGTSFFTWQAWIRSLGRWVNVSKSHYSLKFGGMMQCSMMMKQITIWNGHAFSDLGWPRVLLFSERVMVRRKQGWGQFLFFNSIPIPIPLRSIPIPIPIPLGWKIAIPIPIPIPFNQFQFQFQFLFINSFSIPF